MAVVVQDRESKFVSALAASLEGFVHRTLKEQQRECIRRIVCEKKRCFRCASHGIRQKRHLSVDTQCCLLWGVLQMTLKQLLL